MHEIIQLPSIEVKDKYLAIHSANDLYSVGSTFFKDVFPGKFHVLKHVYHNNGDTIIGDLYLLHEKFAKEEIPLDEYAWQHETTVKSDGSALAIKELGVKIAADAIESMKIQEDIGEDIVKVINNSVCFTMNEKILDDKYAHIEFGVEIYKKYNRIVGMRIQNIGALVNTLNRQLVKACRNDDLETVRKLLTNPMPEQRAQIEYDNYACFKAILGYGGSARIVKYLMTSHEIKNHASINESNLNRFIDLYYSNPSEVIQLIHDLPLQKIHELKNLIDNYQSEALAPFLEIEPLMQAFDLRLFAEQLNEDLPQHNIKTRKSKI